jgi:4-carboxymuconolactone decarboxylase
MGATENSGKDSRRARGLARLDRLNKDAWQRVQRKLEATAPELTQYIADFAYGEVYDTDKLDMRSREIATVAALTALGNARPELKAHVQGALNAGVTREELVAVITQMAVYAGFPAAINGIEVLKEVLAERGG